MLIKSEKGAQGWRRAELGLGVSGREDKQQQQEDDQVKGPSSEGARDLRCGGRSGAQ